MKRKYAIASILVLSLFLPSVCLANNVIELVQKTAVLLSENNFPSVSELYLLPSKYSATEVQEEEKGMAEALTLLSNEFGTASNFETNQENVLWYNLDIMGGDIDFLQKNPNFYRFVLKTEFSKLGSGFIIINVYENSGDPKLRGISYALPQTEENLETIKGISGKLFELMQQKINEKERNKNLLTT